MKNLTYSLGSLEVRSLKVLKNLQRGNQVLELELSFPHIAFFKIQIEFQIHGKKVYEV